MLDYIIVGSGLAGIALCEKLLKSNKTFVVFNNDLQNSSKIAAGLYNPVILKRFSSVWHAKEQYELLTVFYRTIEEKLNVKIDHQLPLLRKLFSIEEQNNWFAATDNYKIGSFLSNTIIYKDYPYLLAKYGYGSVNSAGFIDTKLLLSEYQKFLQSSDCFLAESFDYSLLSCSTNHIQYKSYTAKNIIFAEGYGIKHNPYFNYLPVDGTKGEILIIKAQNLIVHEIINSSLYLIPLGNHLYKVGATYNWEDKTDHPTIEGQQELVENLKKLIRCDFEILEHKAGIRPTVKDRRPLVGTHPKHKRYHILNGLGTRGVMLAPEMAEFLINRIENNIELDSHINITRYDTLHSANLVCT
jgi:glycine/D-amino acid oxidase-like deaminating enzyme